MVGRLKKQKAYMLPTAHTFLKWKNKTA